MLKLLGNATRFGAAVVALAILSLCGQTARAQSCTSTGLYSLMIQINGLPTTSPQYTPTCFSWGPSASSTNQGVSDELTFTHSTDPSTAVLMGIAQSKQILPSAELQQSLLSNVAIDIQMTNVRIISVREAGGSNGPEEIVTLKFDSVVYTFQSLLANGQKNGPSQTFSVTFKK